MDIKEYIHFMCNPENSLNCAECPENEERDLNRADRCYPCGQQHCWVDIHCREMD